jgi:hypothetical protein
MKEFIIYWRYTVHLDLSAHAPAIIHYLATHLSESFQIRTGNVSIGHERYVNKDCDKQKGISCDREQVVASICGENTRYIKGGFTHSMPCP